MLLCRNKNYAKQKSIRCSRMRFISTDVNPGIAFTGIPEIGTKPTGSKSLQPDLKIKTGEICCFTGGSAKYYAGELDNYEILFLATPHLRKNRQQKAERQHHSSILFSPSFSNKIRPIFKSDQPSFN